MTFLGPSGCGKTTLLRVMSGYEARKKVGLTAAVHAAPVSFGRAAAAGGLVLTLPGGGRAAGETLAAILRPTDFTPAADGIPGAVTCAVYPRFVLHQFVAPLAGGPEIRVTLRDGAFAPEAGAPVHPAHVLESA